MRDRLGSLLSGETLGRGLGGAVGRWTPGDPRGLQELWVWPATEGASPAHQGKLARCFPSGAFFRVGSVGARWWRSLAEREGLPVH